MGKTLRNIMIIEDDEAMVTMYKNIVDAVFENVSFTVCYCVDDVIRDIKLQPDRKWDVYICDLRIPSHKDIYTSDELVFNGFELIEKYLIPCRTIIASGYISPEIGAKARELGVAAIYQKPANFSALTITINFLFNCLPQL